jgi:hypothetical protein
MTLPIQMRRLGRGTLSATLGNINSQSFAIYPGP